jgi:alpha-galactosidase
MDPLSFWQKNDAEDRQGITENHHVTGYLAYWDELRRRHPNMLIDSCASGGRRNDLETMRRAVPLLRSDYIMEPVGNQGHTYGLSLWLPFQGTGTGSREISPYLLRSTLVTHFTACFDVRRKDLDYDMIRRVLGQWKQYAPYYFGDYYPLTAYSLDQTAWMAWQFDVPEKGEGVVQAFRRAESVYEAARFKLRGLDAGAEYVLTNLDTGESQTLAGRELLDKGLAVVIAGQPGSAVIVYKKTGLRHRPRLPAVDHRERLECVASVRRVHVDRQPRNRRRAGRHVPRRRLGAAAERRPVPPGAEPPAGDDGGQRSRGGIP